MINRATAWKGRDGYCHGRRFPSGPRARQSTQSCVPKQHRWFETEAGQPLPRGRARASSPALQREAARPPEHAASTAGEELVPWELLTDTSSLLVYRISNENLCQLFIKKNIPFYEKPVICLRMLRPAHGNNMSPSDSETVCKPDGQKKPESKQTWYLKNNILEKSNWMRDLTFQKTKQNKPSCLQTRKMIENKLNQVYYQQDYTDSEKKYQKEISQQNALSLPDRVSGEYE